MATKQNYVVNFVRLLLLLPEIYNSVRTSEQYCRELLLPVSYGNLYSLLAYLLHYFNSVQLAMKLKRLKV